MTYAIEWTGDPSGWEVENIFRQYGINTVGRAFRKGADGQMEFRIVVPEAQRTWADYVFKKYVGGSGEMPPAWGVPTKTGPVWGLLNLLVGEPADAKRIGNEARERRRRSHHLRPPGRPRKAAPDP